MVGYHGKGNSWLSRPNVVRADGMVGCQDKWDGWLLGQNGWLDCQGLRIIEMVGCHGKGNS